MSFFSRIDRYFPREVMAGLVVGFSGENVISAVFEATIPPYLAAVVWGVIFVLSALFVGYWTIEDDESNFD